MARAETSRRVRRIWRFTAALVVGTGLSTALLAWVEASRDTDLADPAAEITAVALEAAEHTATQIRFRDATVDMKLAMRHGPGPRRRLLPEDTGSGLAWGDYDGDGDWDLYVVNFPGSPGQTADADGANRLFRNDGHGFTDVTEEAGVADQEGFGMGATFVDYDDDGDVDLYVANFGPNRLFRHRGDGTFEEVAAQAGVADPSWSTGVAWGDFDRDGHVDLYVCNYVRYDVNELESMNRSSAFGDYTVPFSLNPNSFDPAPNRLYRNRGDGTFEDVAVRCGVDNAEGRSFAATFCDLDGDGWLDLYVANDVSENKLFRNTLGDAPIEQFTADKAPFVVKLSEMFGRRRDGKLSAFVDLSAVTGVADARGSMGLSVGEIGQMTGAPDGLPDLFITHWVAQENALYQSQPMPDGFLEYRDKTRQFGLGEISLERVGWGCGLADVDLDGRVDLLVANGSTLEQNDDASQLIPQPLFVFWNDGKQFRNVAAASGLDKTYSARGLAIADFDNDGDADFAVSVNRGAPLLLRNDTRAGNHSLKIRLRGRASQCFGARVDVTVDGRVQTQWRGADVSFLSMHSPELIFGLGRAREADEVLVKWADATTQNRTHVAAGICELHYHKSER
jgi:hypothetical protein